MLGASGMIGQTAVVRGPFEREGQVVVQGELWRAVAEGDPIADGDLVRVVGVDGLTLRVVKAAEPTVVKAGEPGGTP
jgi:membrane-bound ClpP family serine protease